MCSVTSVLRYLQRFDDELEQIEIVNSIKGRSGQQHVARKDAIKMTLEVDNSEYNGPGIGTSNLLCTLLMVRSRCKTLANVVFFQKLYVSMHVDDKCLFVTSVRAQ